MSDMTALDYRMMVEDTVIDTFLTEYRERPTGAATLEFDDWPLKAVALCDRLSDGISMVYSFYDPADSAASLGTFMILEHIAFAQRIGLPNLYLGYWIEGSRKMAYKTRFNPQERLGPDRWERIFPEESR
jgi:arginine-tRNA-protein transferase